MSRRNAWYQIEEIAPATSYQLIHGEDSVSCIEVRAHTNLYAGWADYVMCNE